MTPPLEPLPRLLAFPPFLYLTAFVLGWLLDRLAPLQAMPALVARSGGALLAVASISLLGWSRIILHRAGTTSLPGRVSMALTLAGPYRWTRNPMMRHSWDAPRRSSYAAALLGPQLDGIEPGGGARYFPVSISGWSERNTSRPFCNRCSPTRASSI
jgi:hypothetical protein